MDEATRRQVDSLQTADLALHQRLRRQKLAKEAGLPLDEEGMILGSAITVNHHPPQQQAKRNSPLRALLAGGALLAAGAAGAAGLCKALPLANAPAAVSPGTTPGNASAPPPPQEFRIRWWVEDGDVKTEIVPQP